MATSTRRFGAGNRESHDASAFYGRGIAGQVEWSTDRTLATPPVVDRIWCHSSESMPELPDNSVALMVTSPPYHVGKDYDADTSFEEYLALLERVFAETYRVLEPGGRAVVNVANLGRKPYVPLAALVTQLMTGIGFFMRGEVIWRKAEGAGGSCAWGSWRSASNPTLRDVHEYCLCFSKGRMDRVRRGVSTIERDEFLAATLSIWDIPPESARRVGHPAPFPVALPRRFIELYTFLDDVVLDPFMGSGSTAVAAASTGRRYVGYDLDAAFVATAERRVAAVQPAVTVPVNDDDPAAGAGSSDERCEL